MAAPGIPEVPLAPPSVRSRRRFAGWGVTATLLVLTAVFVLAPLVTRSASIQGDAADVHYPLQKYVGDRWRTGLPFWTPYIYGGYPLLANPKAGVWYPVNWPFLVAGIRPRSIQTELAVNAAIALFG